MTIRIPAVLELSDDAVRALRRALTDDPQGGTAMTATINANEVQLPDSWYLLEEREGETYSWPEGPDEYETFRIYEGTTSEGTVSLALGVCERVEVRGRDRRYVITHLISPGGAKRPIAEFLETDDYPETGELIAIIKGKDASPKMYDPTDDLPTEYGRFRVETYRDRVDVPGSYQKLGVVAHEDDVDTMLGHTLIQMKRRRLWPF